MRRSLGAALRLFFRWEVWILVGGAIVSRVAGLYAWSVFGASFREAFGNNIYLGLVMTALSCGVLGFSTVLLLPLSRGGRGLDFPFLSRHVATALAGAAIALGTLLPYSFLVWFMLRGGSTESARMIQGMYRTRFIAVDLSVLLCAWYVHGKEEQERGCRPPGPWLSFKVGLTVGILALWIPGVALRMFIENSMPWGLEGVPYLFTMFTDYIGTAAIPLFFTAWFYGTLGGGVPGKSTA